jgi:Protein of unknown function (DUF1194)
MLIGAASLSARPPAFSIILANTTNQKSWHSPARNQDKGNPIGGAGSFVMVVEDYNSFGRAMVRKLIAEIATRPEQQRSVMNVQARTTSNFSSKPRMLGAQGQSRSPVPGRQCRRFHRKRPHPNPLRKRSRSRGS